MFTYRRRISNFCVTVLLSVPLLTGMCLGSMGNGPSLLVYESDYAELRARASQQPWGYMKTRAIDSSNLGYGTVGGGDYNYVKDRMSSSALAYILDEPNQTTYKDRIYDGIMTQLDKLNIGENYGHAGVVKGANALFVAINSLDVIYNDLTATQQTYCVSKIQSKVNLINEDTGYWPLARRGLHGTWKVFKGESYNPDAYYNEIMDDISSDGVFEAGSAYAHARYHGGDRYVKSLFMDILEHTGIDNRYYNNSRIQEFHEWMCTATVSPSHRFVTFGDSNPAASAVGFGCSPVYRAAKFGDTVAGYASWITTAGLPPTGIFSYVIPDNLYLVEGKAMPAPVAVAPKSKVYMEGGGWFWEDNVTEKSLMGALWAPAYIPWTEGHAHKESNAIYMAAYGEHVLLNSGYPTYGENCCGYPWSWFHDNARSANTVLVNNLDHASKSGGGALEEGFTSHGFDYACGNDGPALANDTHLRSFIFVKPQDGKNGYFLLFDEVDADAGETVNVLLHPNTKATTGITTVSDKREYQATIDGMIPDGNTDIKLTVFYGTAPTSVAKEDGAIGHENHGDGGFEGKYLNAQYGTDSSGNVQVATVLFPHNDTHAKATMARLSGTGYNGASADHGDGVVDYVLASDGTTDVTCAGATFKAKSAVFRKLGSELGFYFVRDGLEFSDGDVGFEAASDISIHVDELLGMIRSDGTEVKFLCPYLQEVWLNGEELSVLASGDGWMSVYVAPGTHDLEFVVPEPATLSLLAMGGVAIIRRRRKSSVQQPASCRPLQLLNSIP